MKKLLLSVFAASSVFAATAQCSDLFISEYTEGSNNNKALEIYNPTNAPINLNNQYRLIRYNNGTSAAAGEANAQAILNLGTHTIAPYDVWVITIDKRDAGAPCPGQECAVAAGLQAVTDAYFSPNYNVNYSMYFNGNDALSLQKTTDGGATWSYVDIFGKMGDAAMVSGYGWSDIYPYDGSTPGSKIWTENHTLRRKASVMNGVTVNPTEFNPSVQYDSLPMETWTGFGSHDCDCEMVSVSENGAQTGLKVYPNPVSGEIVNLTATENIVRVELFNAIGQLAGTPAVTGKSQQLSVSTSGMQPGIYYLKATFESGFSKTVKISVQK